MRIDNAYFLDMLIAARKIQRFVGGMRETEFNLSDLHQSAVLRELQVIGEAARLVSDEARNSTPQVPWQIIAGLRNRIIHEYFRVNVSIVWQTVSENIPVLIKELELLLPPPEDSDID